MLYDFHTRHQNPSWSFHHVAALIDLAESNRNSSFIIYAALECRNIFEKIEHDILLLAAIESNYSEWIEIIKRKNGIQQINEKYKVLKFRYQTFTEAFALALMDNCPIKSFGFQKSTDFQMKLSQYLHIYYRTDQELLYESSFIQNGILLINEAIEFIKSNISIIDNGLVYGTLNFSTLSDSMKVLFTDWLNGFSTNTKELTNKLIELNKIQNDGKKVKVSFK